MNILTSDTTAIRPYIRHITMPGSISHKGQNGKILVIGGSSLFHGAVLWAAEAASHIVDMVHVASTIENNEIIQKIKVMWQTGIVIPQHAILDYAQEDDVMLIGNGMMRTEKNHLPSFDVHKDWSTILDIQNEGEFTRDLVYYLITRFPDKQFVLDAGALQMMEPEWLLLLHKKAIITPHQKEFQTLFSINLSDLSSQEKEEVVKKTAQEYSCIILLKTIDDIISDGSKTVCIHGGNAGLTKGGTGDILAGLVAGICASSDPFTSAIVASLLLKKTAEELFTIKGYWYTAKDIVAQFPVVFYSLLKGL
ncbi:MAG: NAD(P)H-hydrate dehydratase [Candidatus Roizmanbacteria bacterium]|nr:NAD(P)H-hydrate dehydratase [Candidatus Roizmanbacteria bacterium]